MTLSLSKSQDQVLSERCFRRSRSNTQPLLRVEALGVGGTEPDRSVANRLGGVKAEFRSDLDGDHGRRAQAERRQV